MLSTLPQIIIAQINNGWWLIVQQHTLYKLLATERNILTILGCWILSWIVGKMIVNASLLKNYKEHWVYGFKLVICSILVWMPGLRPGLAVGQLEIARGTGIDGEEIGYRLVLGVILSGIAIVIPLIVKWVVNKYLPEKLARGISRTIF